MISVQFTNIVVRKCVCIFHTLVQSGSQIDEIAIKTVTVLEMYALIYLIGCIYWILYIFYRTNAVRTITRKISTIKEKNSIYMHVFQIKLVNEK